MPWTSGHGNSSGAVLLLIGAIACGVPIRRALRIQPVEALREG